MTAAAEIASVLDHVRDHMDRPWLIVGKGPSAAPDRLGDLPRYHLFTLNHACGLIAPDDPASVAHFADVAALLDCLGALAARPDAAVCMPWWPHVRFKPGRSTFEDVSAVVAGRRPLLSYNSSVAHNLPRNRLLPEIRVRFFSAVAAFNILARAGCRTIHTIGVDGGTCYAPQFAPKDRLANGRAAFDDQFPEIAATARRLNINHVRL